MKTKNLMGRCLISFVLTTLSLNVVPCSALAQSFDQITFPMNTFPIFSEFDQFVNDKAIRVTLVGPLQIIAEITKWSPTNVESIAGLRIFPDKKKLFAITVGEGLSGQNASTIPDWRFFTTLTYFQPTKTPPSPVTAPLQNKEKGEFYE